MIELFAGVLFIFLNQAYLLNFYSKIIGYHLFRIPTSWILTSVEWISAHLTTDVKSFISIVLIATGFIKVFLSINLALRKLWAFPIAIGFLLILMIYQTYKSFYFHSPLILLLNITDILIIIFIWKEYLHRKGLES